MSTAKLLARATLQASRRMISAETSSSSESEGEGPGRSNTADGAAKATYARRPHSGIYGKIREYFTDPLLFDTTVQLSRQAFDKLHSLFQPEVQKSMNVRHRLSETEMQFRGARKRRLDSEELLFLFFCMLGRSNEGGIGVETVAIIYGLSTGTVSNNCRHALLAVHETLDSMVPRIIRWPDAAKREAIDGLVIRFPGCV